MQLSKALGISAATLTKHPAKLECLLDSLLEQGVIEIEDISMITSSNFKRGYTKDISSVKLEKPGGDPYSERQILRLEVAREGLYDMLPKSLFHVFSDARTNTVDEGQAQRQKIQEEEKAARRFFYPFEQEFLRKRVEIEAMEQKNLSGFLSPIQNFILQSIWPAAKDLGAEQKGFLFYMLPIAHKIAGNFSIISRLFKILLKENVHIGTIHKEICWLEDGLGSTLGDNSILGLDYVPGADVLNDLPGIDICIGPVDIASAPDYLPGGPQERLINLLCDNFMPFDLDTSWRVLVEPRTGSCNLDESANMNVLGYSTVLEI